MKFIRFGIAFLMSGCITVNVNFPEHAVQRAADDFVHDLYKEDAGKKENEKSEEKKKASILFGLLFPSAFATEDLNMSTAKAKEIRSRMATRVSDIVGWKGRSALGESFNGKLVLKDDSKLSPKISTEDRKKLQTLVDQENKDRDELYEEVQRANSISDHGQARIRKFFGSAFKRVSPEGTWIEDENGKWMRK